MRVWKFAIGDPESPISLPRGAEILSVAVQRGVVCLWALVDPEQPREDRHLVVAGTGQDVPDERGRFLGTVLLADGDLVFHIWDRA